jgi:hypothetical protein
VSGIPADSFAAREAGIARDVLDRVVLELDSLPKSADGEAVSAQARDAQRALSAVGDRSTDADEHLARLARAERELGRLIAALGRPVFGSTGTRLANALEPARRALAEARAPTIDQLAAQPWRAGGVDEGERPFTTSWGIPRLFATPHPATAVPPPAAETPFAPPSIDVDDLFAELRQLDEADLEDRLARAAELADPGERAPLVLLRPPRPTEDIDLLGAAGELAQLRRIARDCLESIGVLGNLRALEGDERWGDATEGFEARMLAKLDALMALGVGHRAIVPLDEAIRHAADGPTGDVFRAFARALVLGCSDSEAAARAAVVEMRRSVPITLDAQADALALASSPAVDEVIRSACREESDPRRLVAFLKTLRRRGAKARSEVLPLLQHADDAVRAEAVRFVDASERNLLDRAMEDPSEEVVAAALETLLSIDRRVARERLRASLSAEVAHPGTLARAGRARFALLLAIGGEARDAELLCAALDDQATTVAALGWHGHPGHLEPLLARLGTGPIAVAAARALHRITGAVVGEGADGYAPSTSAERWRAWCVDHAASWGDERRRLGEPFTLRGVADELGRRGVPICDREILALELFVANAPRGIDVHAWMATQEAALAALGGERVGPRRFLDSVTPGSWLSSRAP